MGIRRLAWLRSGLVVLYGLAIAMLPLAHHANGSSSARTIRAELSDYAMPDGSLPLLCLSGKSDNRKNTSPMGCLACSLAAAPGLISPQITIAQRDGLGTLKRVPVAIAAAVPVASVVNASARPRAPPMV